jgi:hypothetical protein
LTAVSSSVATAGVLCPEDERIVVIEMLINRGYCTAINCIGSRRMATSSNRSHFVTMISIG